MKTLEEKRNVYSAPTVAIDSVVTEQGIAMTGDESTLILNDYGSFAPQLMLDEEIMNY